MENCVAQLMISRTESNVYRVQIFGISDHFGMREFQNREALVEALLRTFEYSQDTLNTINKQLDESTSKRSPWLVPLSPEQTQRLIERDLK